MQKKYLIGVDLGTSGTKAALYQLDGRLVTDAFLEVPIYHPRPGVVEQENNDFYQTAARTVSQCIQQGAIDPRQVAASASVRAPVIELHTGKFADAPPENRKAELARLEKAAQQAHQLGLQVNADHGLRLANLPGLLRVPHLHTLNIGHSLVSHALSVGLERSVRDFLEAIAAS